MQRCSGVLRCAELAGHVDYPLTVVTRDMGEFRDFTRAHLAPTGSRASPLALVLRQSKDGAAWQSGRGPLENQAA